MTACGGNLGIADILFLYQKYYLYESILYVLIEIQATAEYGSVLKSKHKRYEYGGKGLYHIVIKRMCEYKSGKYGNKVCVLADFVCVSIILFTIKDT